MVTHTFNSSTGNIPGVVTYTLNPSKSEFEVILVYRRLSGRQWWCQAFNLNLDVKQLSEEGI